MVDIQFKKSNIMTGIFLCIAFIVLLLFIFYTSSNSYAPILIFLICITLHILYFHKIKFWIDHKNGRPGLSIEEQGILNNTADTSIFIPWEEIQSFESGFFRTQNQIFIKVRNEKKYDQVKRTTYLTALNKIGRLFRSKPDLLWIDVDVLAISEQQLLTLLRSRLAKNNRQA